jgi:Plasma-membrane choline transporter
MSLARDHRKSAPSSVFPPEKRLPKTTEAASIATSSTSSRRSSSHFSGDSPEVLLPSLVTVLTTSNKMETRHNRRSNSDIPISVQTGAFRNQAPLPPQNRRAPIPPPSPVHQRQPRRNSPSHSSNPLYIPQQMPYAMPPPSSPVYYPRGVVGPPPPDERQPLLYSHPASRSTQHLSHHQRPQQRYSSRHRKSLSSSAAEPGTYGAFWNDPPQSQGFSPAADLRQLGLSPTAAQSRKQQRLLMPSNSWKGESQSERWQPPSRRHQYHVRQLSIQQHLVQDAKGVPQPLACRNVFFLLLFVFHLIFLLFYWGPRYAPNALVEHTGYTYTSLIAIAGWSGVFAVAVSALLLGFMTYWASHFIQIALFAMITLSFIWGTIGIGVSPKTVVPVTGVIALALAVAYTFIVWDRIPFATANLVTALSGLRDCPSIVAVALFFQLLAGIYSVAFSLVVFGFYDEATQQSVIWSPRRLYTVYALLMLSFAWTLQVIQVRGCCLRVFRLLLMTRLTIAIIGISEHRSGDYCRGHSSMVAQ